MGYKDTDLNLLRVFDAVLKAGSVTRAGQNLGLSQPAMSYALRRLRELFKDPLFVRAQNTLLPTPRARDLAAPIAEALDFIRSNVLQDAHFVASDIQREFVLSLTQVGQVLFLPALVQRLPLLAPGAKLRVKSVTGLQLGAALECGEVDIAIGFFPDLPESVYQQRLYEEDIVCICGSNHPTIGEALTLRQYTQHRHAVVESPMRVHEPIEKELAKLSLKRQVFLVVPDYLSLPGVLERSDLLATVPRTIANALRRFGPIKVVKPPMQISKRTVHQYWHSRYNNDLANKWLRSVVNELFSQSSSQQA